MQCPALGNHPPSGAVKQRLGTHQNSCTWLLGRGWGWSRWRRGMHTICLCSLVINVRILECGSWRLGSSCCF